MSSVLHTVDRSQSQFQIFVRTYLNGYQTVTLDVGEDDLIFNVFMDVCKKINVKPPPNPIMIHQGRKLHLERSIKDYNIKKAETIHLKTLSFITPTIEKLSKHFIQHMVNNDENMVISPRLQVLYISAPHGHSQMVLSDGQYYIRAQATTRLPHLSVIDLKTFCYSVGMCFVNECHIVRRIEYPIGNPKDIFHAPFTIYISFFGKKISAKCKDTATVKDLKTFIYKKEGIPVERQSLLFNGHPLSDSRTLMYYKIKQADTIHLMDYNVSFKIIQNLTAKLQAERRLDRKQIQSLKLKLIKANIKKDKEEKKILLLKKKLLQSHINKKFMCNPLVLIVCINEYRISNNLPGTLVDQANMINLFKHKYKYNTFTIKKKFVKLSDLKKTIRECRHELNKYETDNKRNSKYDGIVVVLSCHGNGNDEIITSDEQKIKVDSIREHFNGHHTNVPSLVNTPKLFIIDACRGKNKPELTVNGNIGNVCKGKTKRHHPDKNCITINCTTKGYSTDDTMKGGYLIQAVDEILKNDEIVGRYDLIRLTECIKRKVLLKTKNMNCTESTSTTFDADFYLKANINKKI